MEGALVDQVEPGFVAVEKGQRGAAGEGGKDGRETSGLARSRLAIRGLGEDPGPESPTTARRQ